MSKNYFYHSIFIENYRGLNSLHISKLKRINILGGLNGVGKSTVLEAILLMCARLNPIILSRPFLRRQIKMPYPNGFDYVFFNYDHTRVISVTGAARSGRFDFKVKTADVHNAQVNAPNSPSIANEMSQASGESRGLSMSLKTDDLRLSDEMTIVQPSPDDFGLNVAKGNIAKTPFCQFISLADFNPIEDAQRYSALVKERNTNPLISYLRVLFPDLMGLQLLHESGSPSIYVQFSDESLVPSMMLGGGFQMMFSIALVMMTSRDGVFLFDEVDSAIHHSLLPQFWETVSTIADSTNAQVFAVTHSRECIGAAVKGMIKANKLDDLAYFRLEERLQDIQSVAYTGEELEEALLTDWEIR